MQEIDRIMEGMSRLKGLSLLIFLFSQSQESIIRHIHSILKITSTFIDKHKDRVNELVEGGTTLILGSDVVLLLCETNIRYQLRSHRSKIYITTKVVTIRMSVKKNNDRLNFLFYDGQSGNVP